MCDPLTIAGIALMAGSVAANTIANNQVQQAQNAAVSGDETKQRALDQEAAQVNQKSLDSYKDFQPQQAANTNDLTQYFTGQPVSDPSAEPVLPTSSSNLVVQEEAKQRDKAKAFTDQTGAALANLRSFGDVLADKSLSQARDAGTIGQIGSFKSGWNNLLPLQLDDASHAGDGTKLLGDILNGLGTVSTSAGLRGTNILGIGSGVPTQATGVAPGTLTLYGGV